MTTSKGLHNVDKDRSVCLNVQQSCYADFMASPGGTQEMEQQGTFIKQGSWLSLPENEPREENVSSIFDLISGKTTLENANFIVSSPSLQSVTGIL